MRLSALVSLAVALVSYSGSVQASVLNSRKASGAGVIVSTWSSSVQYTKVKLTRDPAAADLNNQLPLPELQDAKIGARDVKLNTDEIQGLTMVGMRFMMETFLFFNVTDAHNFKLKLGSEFHPRVTTATQLIDPTNQAPIAVNIAFSQKGLNTIEVNDDLGDPNFKKGQAEDAVVLGDPGTVNWREPYQKGVHGVIQIASKEMDKITAEIETIKGIFGSSFQEVYRLNAEARPGPNMGHEHFGWVDGIAQPAIEGWDTEKTTFVPPGIILVGEEGDTVQRPAWAKSGSFLCWRQLSQLVPEFSKYLNDTAPPVEGLSEDEARHLFGSRMVGQWKSGAPIDLAPLKDDLALGADPQRRNNFTFDHPEIPGFDLFKNQTICPFSSHILRSRPRAFFKPEHPTSHFMRGGLPYGPEVTSEEAAAIKSSDEPILERGMAFAAYQSNLANGFIFVQQSLVDNPEAPPGPSPLGASASKTLLPCALAGQAPVLTGPRSQLRPKPSLFS
ncbi:dye-decolorizing heme-containing peroxidase [Marasmius crinis-equi]|uniref:Dye-decolorizing heme-containing peroxidase n=1 Tax=Marasmius crinis-equi TaxID=585013 RepID=A0ABR3ERM5_9AGAR